VAEQLIDLVQESGARERRAVSHSALYTVNRSCLKV
jgi:hypothetical protein